MRLLNLQCLQKCWSGSKVVKSTAGSLKPSCMALEGLLYWRMKSVSISSSIRLSLIFFLLGLLSSPVISLPAQPTVTSTINPNSIALGYTATYIVSIQAEEQPPAWLPPKVQDLEIDFIGTGQSMQISTINRNTKTIVTKKYNFRVKPKRTGRFIIPTYDLSIGRQRIMVPAAVITVNSPNGKPATNLEDLTFLELDKEERPTYVGQNLKYVLKLFVHTGLSEVRAGELLQKGDAFSQHEMAQSTNSYGARRNNLDYQVYEIPVSITPLKSGLQTLEFELTIQVALPRQRQSSSSSYFDEFFNKDFFSFGGFRERRNISVSTGPVEIAVRMLPEEGKPKSFSGAIGQFLIKQTLSPIQINAGDPLTLKVEITGNGNFDRIQPLQLEAGDQWKIYPPKSEFIAGDKMEHSGKKIFDYILIPQSIDITQSPPIHFSFFDPRTAQYVQLSHEQVALTVNPATDYIFANTSVTQTTTSNNDTLGTSKAPERNILPIQLLPGRWISSIQPTFKSSYFLSSQLIPLIIFSSIYLFRKRQIRFREDAFYARRLKTTQSMRKWLKSAKEASSKNDFVAFFAAAQRAIQESVGKHFTCSASTLTLADLELFLLGKDSNSKTVNEVRKFFEAGDAVRFFAGNQAQEQTLLDWNRALLKLIAQLSALK
ncbi:MAG: hypothetical protein DF168_01055 [Candidatus Moanabacter tarae]|uniref:Protein BatD n=1 Tax=Candidatus Moanibacter tarae TaxID=2200854 RepID=A0A2Z4AFT8_9BACT|nr:MAG: hypothetical protein DF168_01055 [Candidatus Moanabacter tarae]